MIPVFRNVDAPNGDFGLTRQEGDEEFVVLTKAEAQFYKRALKFVAAYKAYADAIGSGLSRKGTEVVWADKEQHAQCIDLLIAHDALGDG